MSHIPVPAAERPGCPLCPPRLAAQVLDKAGKVLPNVYCIGDANGKYMLAHAASAQGISAVENMCGREHVVDHLAVPAACFTHPEVSFRPLCLPASCCWGWGWAGGWPLFGASSAGCRQPSWECQLDRLLHSPRPGRWVCAELLADLRYKPSLLSPRRWRLWG
jgi:hypothetical protein